MDAQDAELLRLSLVEIRRYRNMDRLIPSYHNVVTIATIEVRDNLYAANRLPDMSGQFNLILSLANIIPHEAGELIPMTRYVQSLS